MSQPFDARLLLEHAEFLRGLARSLVGDAALADDVVQETFAVALERPPAPGNLRAWLATVAKSIAFGQRRTAVRRQRRERAVARAEPVASVAETAARLDVQKRLVHAVGDLEEPLRSTVVARFYDQLSFEEIAARDGVSVKTVSRRLDAALERLRGQLDAQHGGNRGAWTTLLLPLCGKKRRAVGAAATTAVLWQFGRSAALMLLCAAVGLAAVLLWLASRGEGPARLTASMRPSDGVRGEDRSAPAQATRPEELRVRVLRWEDREPLAGTAVRVLREGALQETAETDAAGMAALANAVPGDVVRVAAEDRVPVERPVPEGLRTMEVELEPGLPLRGRVVTADSGHAPADVHLWITESSYRWPEIHELVGIDPHLAIRLGKFIDEEARFSTIVPTDRPLRIAAAAPGYFGGSAEVRRTLAGVVEVFPQDDTLSRGALVIRGEDEVEIVLGKGLTVSGAVVTESGEPAGHAEVLFVASDSSDSLSPPSDWAQAPVDENGAFTMRGLPPGNFDIIARKGAEGVRTRVRVDAGEPATPVRLKLSSRPCLRVQVLDAQGGLLDHWVHARAENPWTTAFGAPRKHGEPQSILLSRTGLYRVCALRNGWRREVDVDVAETGYRDLVFRVEDSVLEGVVTDDAGQPVPGVDVSFVASAPDAPLFSSKPSAWGHTDAQGRFAIRGTDTPKGELIVASMDEAYSEGAARYWMEERILGVAAGMDPVHVQLRRAPCVRLRVRPSIARLRWSVDDRRVEPPLFYEAVRGPDGAFSLPIRGEGVTTLTIVPPGHMRFDVPLPALEEGMPLDLGEFSLEPGFEVQGIIRAGGKPVPGAQVDLWDGVNHSEQTDPQGEFRTRAVMGSQGTIWIHGRGIMPVQDLPVSLSPGCRLTFDLEEAGHLAVDLADAGGRSVETSRGPVVAVPLDDDDVESRDSAILVCGGQNKRVAALRLGRYQLYYTGSDGIEHRGPRVVIEHIAELVEVFFKLPQ